MRPELPAGTVTFLFTDIEGSTALLHELGPEDYAEELAEHRRLVRSAVAAHGGVEVDTQGDAFFVAFPSAAGAVAAAEAAQQALSGGRIRVRMGVHTGEAQLGDEGYVGVDVHLGARICAAGHGGQVLVSGATRASTQAELLDLGEHRLKDFDQPVPIYQLGSARFPPLRTVANTNLPRPASGLVGREQELRDVVGLLRGGDRLVTLTGPGGSGKTRLALEATSELVGSRKAGIFWVELAALRSPDLVLPTVGQTIGAANDVATFIGERDMLLAIDNMEQVIGAAAEVAHLVERCPNLTVLVTSRERLRVRGETQYVVPPLANAEAVTLFSLRSGVPADADVGRLCRALDDLPLAIELAAARARVLPPAQILGRLGRRLDLLKGGRDADARQQTLRATIAWSYDLLDAPEQALFERLSVFAGGVTLEVAEDVVSADVDALEALVDKSLVRSADGRLLMLQTVRDFATERLIAAGGAEKWLRAHAEYFLALAESLEADLLGLHPTPALDRLEADHDNLRAALDWFEQAGDDDSALRLGGALWEFWCLRAHHVEGSRRLERLLTLDERPTAARAKAALGAAHLSTGAGAPAGLLRDRARRAVELQQPHGNAWRTAFAHHELALACAFAGEFAEARERMAEVVEQWRRIGDEHRELQAMRILAWAASELGDPGTSRRLHEEIVARAGALGDSDNESFSLSVLAEITSTEGHHRQALAMLVRAYEIATSVGEGSAIEMTLVRTARVLARAAQAPSAAQLLGTAAALHEELGWAYPEWFAEQHADALTLTREQLEETAFAAAATAGRSLTAAEAMAIAAQVPVRDLP
ncbi:MAG TPA: tetratricopeptide repeat protein [Mycobacteriales bacterium]|nr:tetratricopeptide repeat protein [Mycobacteriales bacterium]